MRNQTIAIVVLSILLVLSVGYIAYNVYQNAKVTEQNQIYQLGLETGYQQAIVTLLNEASTCQPVPVRLNESISVDVIAVACLQQPSQ